MIQLLVIGDTCSQLRTVVRAHYKNTLSSSKYFFGGLGDVQMIQAFRLFGEYFPKVDSEEFDIEEHRFIEAMSHFCSDNLTELKLYRFYINDDVIAKIEHLFPNLKSFQLKCCYFPEEIEMNVLPIQCSKLTTLTIDCAATGYLEESSIRFFNLNTNFPHLKEVNFGYAIIVNMCDFFKMNQQVESYTENDCTTQIFEYIVELLPNIESLNLSLNESVNFENIDRSGKLKSLSISSSPLLHQRVYSGFFNCISLEHFHLSHFDFNSATTAISQLINLKTLKLHKCSINVDFVVDVCKNCTEINEIHILESCDDFPSADQLFEIVRCAEKLEKLVFSYVYPVRIISYSSCKHLAQMVKNRQKIYSFLLVIKITTKL